MCNVLSWHPVRTDAEVTLALQQVEAVGLTQGGGLAVRDCEWVTLALEAGAGPVSIEDCCDDGEGSSCWH
jgi:hypothetical protein